MVHFQDASPACRAMMGAVWLPSLTLLAEPGLAGRFHSEGRSISMGGGFIGGEVGVARMAGRNERRAWIGKDSGSIAPVQENVEDDAK